MKSSFRVREYEIRSEKLRKTPVVLAVLSDLHGKVHGDRHCDLINAILASGADAVLITGDMFNRNDIRTMEEAEKLLTLLVMKIPVYYVPGNHESFHAYRRSVAYLAYEKRLSDAGVRFLHNESVILNVHDSSIRLTGLELPLIYYKKPFAPKPDQEEIERLIMKPERKCYEILLAHNPLFAKKYFAWGADLILSGHYHGGVMRLGKNAGIISPYYHIFPKFCVGRFKNDAQNMIVSAGLGEHTIPLRIHNPRELLIIRCTMI